MARNLRHIVSPSVWRTVLSAGVFAAVLVGGIADADARSSVGYAGRTHLQNPPSGGLGCDGGGGCHNQTQTGSRGHMGLGTFIGREYAHDLVYDLCRESLRLNRPLLDLLAGHPEINRHLDRAALSRLCDPANYLGQAGAMVDRVLGKLAPS